MEKDNSKITKIDFYIPNLTGFVAQHDLHNLNISNIQLASSKSSVMIGSPHQQIFWLSAEKDHVFITDISKAYIVDKAGNSIITYADLQAALDDKHPICTFYKKDVNGDLYELPFESYSVCLNTEEKAHVITPDIQNKEDKIVEMFFHIPGLEATDLENSITSVQFDTCNMAIPQLERTLVFAPKMNQGFKYCGDDIICMRMDNLNAYSINSDHHGAGKINCVRDITRFMDRSNSYMNASAIYTVEKLHTIESDKINLPIDNISYEYMHHGTLEREHLTPPYCNEALHTLQEQMQKEAARLESLADNARRENASPDIIRSIRSEAEAMHFFSSEEKLVDDFLHIYPSYQTEFKYAFHPDDLWNERSLSEHVNNISSQKADHFQDIANIDQLITDKQSQKQQQMQEGQPERE